MRRQLASTCALLFVGCIGYDDDLAVPERVDPLVAEAMHEEPPAELAADAAPEPEVTDDVPLVTSDPVPEPTATELEAACISGLELARSDFAAGTLSFDAWGYPTSCAFKYWELLEKWYGIHTSHHGCVVHEEPRDVVEQRRCYRIEGERLVRERHGDNAFERASRRAGCHR
jgi:hypothetical protein